MTIINKVSSKSVMPGVTAVPDVVDAPTIGSATAGFESATVTYTAAVTGGAATSFTAISTPGSITGSSATSPITVSGLTGGTAYTFKVYGANSSGTWSVNQSASSNSVTPTTTSFDSIATLLGTGSSGELNFTNISQNYKHLQIRAYSLLNQSNEDILLRLGNGSIDTNSNYTFHEMRSVGSGTPTSTGQVNRTSSYLGSNTGNTTYPYVFIADILDYSNTNKFKTIRVIAGTDRNAGDTSGTTSVFSGLWRSTSAVDTLRIYSPLGQFTSGARFALYGISGA